MATEGLRSLWREETWRWRQDEALMVEKPRELAGGVVIRKTSPERDVLMIRGGPRSCLGQLFSRVDLALIGTGSDSGPCWWTLTLDGAIRS